jgi:NTE family protein
VPFCKLILAIIITGFCSQQSFGQLSSKLSHKPAVALVLSGGNARGFAHIGVLEVLDSANIPIDLVVGTSMGAVVGGLYAAGYTPKELEKIAISTNWEDILSFDDDSRRDERLPGKKDEKSALLSLRFNGFFHPVLPQALSSGQRLTMFLNTLVISSTYGTHQDFLHDLKVPFIALATDIVKGERKLIASGDLTTAMRASATLPLRFYPLAHDSSLLVDGGLLTNIPVDVAHDSAKAGIVIASNTTADLRTRNELSTPWDVADQVITLIMRRENLAQLKKADIIITPTLEHGLPDDFQNAAAYIEQGRRAARLELPRLKALLTQPTNTAATDNTILLDVVKEIQIHGLTTAETDSLSALMRPIIGNKLSKASLESDIKYPIIDNRRHNGYSLARIDSIVITTSSSAVDVFIDPGYISDIKIIGLESTQPRVVLDQLPFSKEDIFRSNRCEQGLRNITATGLFSYANIQFIQDTGLTTPIVIHPTAVTQSQQPLQSARGTTTLQLTLTERATQVLRLGGLADNEFGAQFSMEYANESLFGLGGELSIKGGIGALSRYGAVSLSGFHPLIGFSASVYSGYKDISAYEIHEDIPHGRISTGVLDVIREHRDIGGDLKLNVNIGRDASLIGEYRIERQRPLSLQSLTYFAPVDVVSAIRGTITYDTRDDNDYPHIGQLIQGYYEIGTQLLGGTISFTKIELSTISAIPISRLHTLRIRAALGLADRTLPYEEQFALGGIESFFGLNEYELRGKQYAAGSLGYQIAIPNTLFFPTFVGFRYDLGAMWVEPTAIKFESFIHGLGAEIGFKTPIGLARFGLGENFRFAQSPKKPLLLNTPRFYFSIGANL